MARNRGTADPVVSNEVELADDDPRIWGWHSDGSKHKGFLALGAVMIFSILVMVLGNHTGHVETIWLLAIGFIMILMVVIHLGFRRKSTWRK